MNTKYLAKKSGRFLKKHLPEILTITSTIGVGASKPSKSFKTRVIWRRWSR